MTTPTPTSNAPGVSGLTLPVGDVPAGLPDAAALAQLANAFFTALPQYLPAGSASVSSFGSKPRKARAPLTVAQK